MTNRNSSHIVVVEDNQNNYLVVRKLLQQIGVSHCDWYPKGSSAIAFVKHMSLSDIQRRPDLILLDLALPHEDGYTVLTALRADPALCDTRVVAITASASPSEMQRARAAGLDGFIGKPIDPRRFPAQIQRILAGEGVWEL